MKSKVLKIIIVFAMLIFVYATIVDALSFTAKMTASSITVAEATEFTIEIKVSNLDVGTNGINSLSGYLEYDDKVFEKINETNIEGLNSWGLGAFTSGTGKITMTKSTFAKSEEAVLQITFKTKSEVSGSSGVISFKGISASNSESDISASDISTSITVGTVSTNTTNTTNTNSALISANTSSNTNNTNTNTNNTNTNTNTNSNAVSQYVNNTNTSSSNDIPYTGAEDTLIKAIFVLLVVAFTFYIKFERVNKEMK